NKLIFQEESFLSHRIAGNKQVFIDHSANIDDHQYDGERKYSVNQERQCILSTCRCSYVVVGVTLVLRRVAGNDALHRQVSASLYLSALTKTIHAEDHNTHFITYQVYYGALRMFLVTFMVP